MYTNSPMSSEKHFMNTTDEHKIKNKTQNNNLWITLDNRKIGDPLPSC